MLIHRLPLLHVYRDYFNGFEPQARARGAPQMSLLDTFRSIYPEGPQHRGLHWSWILLAYWFIGGFRASFLHTEQFQGTVRII